MGMSVRPIGMWYLLESIIDTNTNDDLAVYEDDYDDAIIMPLSNEIE